MRNAGSPSRSFKTKTVATRLSEGIVKILEKKAEEIGTDKAEVIRSLIVKGLDVDVHGEDLKQKRIQQLEGKVEALMEIIAAKN